MQGLSYHRCQMLFMKLIFFLYFRMFWHLPMKLLSFLIRLSVATVEEEFIKANAVLSYRTLVRITRIIKMLMQWMHSMRVVLTSRRWPSGYIPHAEFRALSAALVAALLAYCKATHANNTGVSMQFTIGLCNENWS